jgi:D-arabinose 1-dehydrogenase-like Zn-dependent alcohol dehydrogenase
MRAVVYDQFGSTPAMRDVDVPRCPPQGAVIQVKATGLCRSDWHGWLGHDPAIVLPHVPGHEFAGVVVEVGREVAGWRVGVRVTVPFVCACGHCAPCREGNPQVCLDQSQPGFTGWGSFAEYVAIEHAAANLVSLPDAVSFVDAACLGCRFATAYRAVVAHSRPASGNWMVVHGCGGVGLSAIQIASTRGMRVIAVDVTEAALDLAASVGASATIDAGAQQVVETVHDLTSGGAHVSIDALGHAGTFANSLACLRPRGRHIQIGLLLADDAFPRVDMGSVIARELEIVGSHGMAAKDYPAMLAEIVEGRLSPGRLVRRTIGLEEAAAALTGMGRDQWSGTTVILP